ncbi:class I SAM-dependent methyltransferase [Flavobacterium algicola]|uniref:class I SAM-dependent methyltransferase n=1 Tax=Flavobacterium algicola TaxID=556529 RepID=UPI001EFEBE17|nr:class I SAM-dependent methyltransferase [Flavobacterium algicola]MCG9793836.1 class I SAM-dependent methyltransferase [Flavobacterium algicola]
MNSIIRKLFYAMPIPMRYGIRRIIYFPADIFRDKKLLMPPKGLIFTGSGDYLKVGQNFFNHFQKYGRLTPDSKVLDIGSGIGRMAIPFTPYLSSEGRYEGFDIVKKGVDWCTKNISSQFPNFNFKLIPLHNDLYNHSTEDKAASLRFPYSENYFDFVFLTSVFTHMMPDDVENYIVEIRRVLQRDKICFCTFFILDEKSKTSMSQNGLKNFPHDFKNYSLMDRDVKEANVAYDKEFLYSLFEKHQLQITHFIRGNWSGVTPGDLNEHQDILIIKKI